jgi:hypothetical protein
MGFQFARLDDAFVNKPGKQIIGLTQAYVQFVRESPLRMIRVMFDFAYEFVFIHGVGTFNN